MPDKILCFRLHDVLLGVEPDQIERVLINKHPIRDAFTLETGVEVKHLTDYVPLPGGEGSGSENILFVKGQKDFFGFSIDKVQGYLKIKGGGKVPLQAEKSPIKYYVKSSGALIPVLDLQYITNTENAVTTETIEEIMQRVKIDGKAPAATDREAELLDVSKDEVYKSIEGEIYNRISTSYVDAVVKSEKKGMVLPLIINIAIVAIFAAGLLLYLTLSRERVKEQTLGGSISGVEEEVIREIRRRSEEEVEEQKRKLENARLRLTELQREKDFFLSNQDAILAEREAQLNTEYQRKLEEARQRILASGVVDVDAAFEKEQERLRAEYLSMTDKARTEIEQVKMDYELELARKEEELNREVLSYSQRIDEIEQKLIEEQAKLKEAEERFQSSLSKQQEYIAFRRQLNSIYDKALTYFSKEDYAKGIDELTTIPPIINSARRTGVGDKAELQVEEKLVNNLLYLAKNHRNRANLNEFAQKTYEAAVDLENLGNLDEALSRYYTVYTIAENNRFRKRALNKAESVLDRVFKAWSKDELSTMEVKAKTLFNTAMSHKSEGNYNRALSALEGVITDYPGTATSKKSVEEMKTVNSLFMRQKEQDRIASLNQQAKQLMRSARESFDNGYLSEAFNKYRQVAGEFQGSDYVDDALSEMVRISETMRSMKASPQIVMKGQGSRTGVIVQISSENTFLFNLGKQDGLEQGDVLGIYRKEQDKFIFIGSVKVSEVYPTISKGRLMYYERRFKIGDLVSPS